MSNKSQITTLLSNTFLFGIGNMASKLILFFLMPLYTAILTTSEYGVGEVLNSTIELLFPLATLSITEAVFRFSIDDDFDSKAIFSIGFKTILYGMFVSTLLGTIIQKLFYYKYTWHIIAMLGAYSFKMLFANYARAIGHTKIFALNGVIASLTLVFYNVILLKFLKFGLEGYLLSIILSNLTSAIFVFISVKQYRDIRFKTGNKEKHLLKLMLIYCLPTIPNLLSWWITNTSSRYMVIFFCGTGIAGKFAAASKLPSMINLLSNVFQQAWQYSSSLEYGKSSSNSFYNTVFKYYSSFILSACSLLIMILPLVSKVLLKGEFLDAWHYAPLLLVSATLGCYSSYFGTFYIASKQNKMLMISTIIGAALNVLMGITLIPIIGVYGALIASIVSYLIIVIIRIMDTKKYVKIDIQPKLIIISLIIILIQAILLTNNNYNLGFLCFVIVFIIHLKNSLFDIILIIKKAIFKKVFKFG